MNILKFCLIFASLFMVLAPVHASKENALQIENLTSISSIVNPATLNLSRSVNAAPEWRNFITPQAFWSPDGSKLLVRSSIRWYKDDINFRPSNRNGIDAMYMLDADGTNLTRLVSNDINNRSTPIELPVPPDYNPWNPSGDIVVVDIGAFYILADAGGDWLNVPGTNFSDMVSIVTNLSEIPRQRNFAWSPDGTRAVYTILDLERSERKYIVKSEKLYITDADGSNIKQLAGEVNESFLGSITWSHNGKQIAFSGKNLWIVNSDGTNLRQFGDCLGSTWSPDDNKLLCMSYEEVNDQIINHLYLINVDSADKTEISKSIEVENPVWSPDGRSILFKSITERRTYGIYVTDSQGKNIKLIYEEGLPVERTTLKAVSWSPDGSKIAFISEKGDKLYSINPDGTGKALLTSNLSWIGDNPYAWSPSGDKIAFSSITGSGEHIFIANPDGTESVQITTDENKRYVLSGIGGSWSPDSSRLLIESRSSMPSRDEVFIAKLSGYDRTLSVQAPELIKQQDGERTPEITNIAAPAPQITESITAVVTPKAPGFNVVLAIEIIYTIYLFKRRYN